MFSVPMSYCRVEELENHVHENNLKLAINEMIDYGDKMDVVRISHFFNKQTPNFLL